MSLGFFLKVADGTTSPRICQFLPLVNVSNEKIGNMEDGTFPNDKRKQLILMKFYLNSYI